MFKYISILMILFMPYVVSARAIVDGVDQSGVTLSSIQAATSSDFHNIGGTDDDVPDAGDFGTAVDLDADGEVANDSHDHTSTTVSGVDISADTNLAAGANITLTDDTLAVDDSFVVNGAADTMGGALTINPGTLFIQEQADASADVAGQGQIWVNTASPNELWFTDDAGADTQLGTGGAFDSTTVDATTWSDGANATNIWTFDVSGTDHTLTAGNALMTFSNGVNVSGDVGIGVAAPLYDLSVLGDASGSFEYVLHLRQDAGAGATTGMLFGTTAGGVNGKGAIVYEYTAGWGGGDMHFLQAGTANDDTLPDLTDAKMTITATGDVGIGTTAPGQLLDVDGIANATTLTEGGNAVYSSGETPGGELGGTFASFTIDDSLAVTSWNLTTPTITTSATIGDDAWFGLGSGAGRMYFDDQATDELILNSVLVGLGTDTPEYAFEFSGADAASTAMAGTRYSADTSPSLWYLRKARGTEGSPAGVSDGDLLGDFRFQGMNGNDSNWDNGVIIRALVNGTPSGDPSDMPSDLQFFTSPDGATATLHLTLRGNGDLDPDGNKAADIGASGNAWDDIWANDHQNEADFYFMDNRKDKHGNVVPIDDLSVLTAILPKGEYDKRTGFQLIDDNSLPNFMLTKYKEDEWSYRTEKYIDVDGEEIQTSVRDVLHLKGEICRSTDGDPYVSSKVWNGLITGAIRQLKAENDELRARIESLESR